jgi:hypothetical protein
MRATYSSKALLSTLYQPHTNAYLTRRFLSLPHRHLRARRQLHQATERARDHAHARRRTGARPALPSPTSPSGSGSGSGDGGGGDGQGAVQLAEEPGQELDGVRRGTDGEALLARHRQLVHELLGAVLGRRLPSRQGHACNKKGDGKGWVGLDIHVRW